jgi:hypothetical protein
LQSPINEEYRGHTQPMPVYFLFFIFGRHYGHDDLLSPDDEEERINEVDVVITTVPNELSSSKKASLSLMASLE